MEFLKVLWNNLRKGPVTDPFPFGETYTPERLRGKVHIDPSLCVGCGTCRHVCVAGAINIDKLKDGTGFEITVWQNTCCQCGQCRHYCPTKAITLTNDWHSAHRNKDKYTQIAKALVPYDYCASCGAKLRFLPPDVLKRIYAGHPEVDVDVISRLCPSCRRVDLAVVEDEACHIDHIKRIVERGDACFLLSANVVCEESAVKTTETVRTPVVASAPVVETPEAPEAPVEMQVAAPEEPESVPEVPASVLEEAAPEVAAHTVETVVETVVEVVAKPPAPTGRKKATSGTKARTTAKSSDSAKSKPAAKVKPSAKAKKS